MDTNIGTNVNSVATGATSNVSSNTLSVIKYAGFWRRFVGWLIDILIIVIVSYWVLKVINLVFPTSVSASSEFSSSSILSSLLFVVMVEALVNFIIVVLYYTLFEASSMQATVGKYVVGIKITDLGGSKISYGRAFVRRIYSLVSIITLAIGYIVAGFTSRKQTFHDMLAKTVVVVNKPRKGIVLFGIFVLTLIVGGLSDKYLGAGFKFKIEYTGNSGSKYNTREINKDVSGNINLKLENEIDFAKTQAIESALKAFVIYTIGDVAKFYSDPNTVGLYNEDAKSKKISEDRINAIKSRYGGDLVYRVYDEKENASVKAGDNLSGVFVCVDSISINVVTIPASQFNSKTDCSNQILK